VWVLLLFSAVGLGYVLAGLLAWSRRPSNRTGPLLCLGGFTLLLAALQNTDAPGLVAVGLILGEAPIAVILHILLAFPSGRLERPLPRMLVGAGYVITIVLQAPRYLFSSSPAVLEVADRHDLAHIGVVIQDSAGAVVLVLAALVLALRLRAATRQQRRVLGLLYGHLRDPVPGGGRKRAARAVRLRADHGVRAADLGGGGDPDRLHARGARRPVRTDGGDRGARRVAWV
jgi:hypothetical protein